MCQVCGALLLALRFTERLHQVFSRASGLALRLLIIGYDNCIERGRCGAARDGVDVCQVCVALLVSMHLAERLYQSPIVRSTWRSGRCVDNQ